MDQPQLKLLGRPLINILEILVRLHEGNMMDIQTFIPSSLVTSRLISRSDLVARSIKLTSAVACCNTHNIICTYRCIYYVCTYRCIYYVCIYICMYIYVYIMYAHIDVYIMYVHIDVYIMYAHIDVYIMYAHIDVYIMYAHI